MLLCVDIEVIVSVRPDSHSEVNVPLRDRDRDSVSISEFGRKLKADVCSAMEEYEGRGSRLRSLGRRNVLVGLVLQLSLRAQYVVAGLGFLLPA